MELNTNLTGYLNKANLQADKPQEDWRQMDSKEWDKLVGHIDKFIDNLVAEMEEMEEMQEDASVEAASLADPSMRATAASSAALSTAATGIEITDGVINNQDQDGNSDAAVAAAVMKFNLRQIYS